MQGRHRLCPDEGWYIPFEHFEQTVDPAKETLPGRHGKHASPVLSPDVFARLPGAHWVHVSSLEAPSALENLPGLQLVHAIFRFAAPETLPHFPAAHGSQRAAPALPCQKPGAQGVHESAPARDTVPAEHGGHQKSAPLSVARGVVPETQDEHDTLPKASAFRPIGHFRQALLEGMGENVLGAQAWH
jgi:hypothetical protein